jgi:peptidoglycan/LPS O-acetylase OafA/YrhL
MAATLRAEVSVTLSTPMREESGGASARAYHNALAYLRAFLVVLVVAHHSDPRIHGLHPQVEDAQGE